MTEETAINYLKNFRMIYADFAPKRFIEALDCILSRPSLPSNLGEAAQKDAIRTYAMPEGGDIDKIFEVLRARIFHEIGFGAGARWTHRQLDGQLDDCIVNEWASHFSPEIRDSIKNTAYHFWDIAREGLK